MAFELIVFLLAALVVSIPAIAWMLLRRLSKSEQLEARVEELRGLENSLSMMIRELQVSVDKGLSDMQEAADHLNQVIEQSDDRIRQLEYFYEFGDELRPLPIPGPEINLEPEKASPTKRIAVRHKEVHELAQKGWSASQIAKHTGMSADEVQLIVNLMEINVLSSKDVSEVPRQPLL